MVGVFPEATISRSFTVKELKSGAARMASSAKVPLLPVALWGTQRLWTKGRPRTLTRRHTPITILIGEPIEPADLPGPERADRRADDPAQRARRPGPAGVPGRSRPARTTPGGSPPTWAAPRPTPEEAAELDRPPAHAQRTPERVTGGLSRRTGGCRRPANRVPGQVGSGPER